MEKKEVISIFVNLLKESNFFTDKEISYFEQIIETRLKKVEMKDLSKEKNNGLWYSIEGKMCLNQNISSQDLNKTILHESIHATSFYHLTDNKAVLDLGLRVSISNKGKWQSAGTGINEGVTEMLTKLIYNKRTELSDISNNRSGYPSELRVACQLCTIIGTKDVINCFMFDGGISKLRQILNDKGIDIEFIVLYLDEINMSNDRIRHNFIDDEAIKNEKEYISECENEIEEYMIDHLLQPMLDFNVDDIEQAFNKVQILFKMSKMSKLKNKFKSLFENCKKRFMSKYLKSVFSIDKRQCKMIQSCLIDKLLEANGGIDDLLNVFINKINEEAIYIVDTERNCKIKFPGILKVSQYFSIAIESEKYSLNQLLNNPKLSKFKIKDLAKLGFNDNANIELLENIVLVSDDYNKKASVLDDRKVKQVKLKKEDRIFLFQANEKVRDGGTYER